MMSFLQLLSSLITLYIWVLVAAVIFSWLIAFGVLNAHSEAVRMIGRALRGLTEPALRPLRRVLPDLGGVDISPVLAILLAVFVKNLIWEYFGV